MKRNPKKKIVTALLCSVLLLGGCGSPKTQSEEDTPEDMLVEENEENAKLAAQSSEEADGGQEALPEDENAGMMNPLKGTEDGRIVIEVGPDKAVWGQSLMTCTLHDFQLYASPEEAGISRDKLVMTDADSYADQSIFLLMQADINDQGYISFEEDGTVNVSMFTIEPKEPVENADWTCSYPVYLSEPGTGASSYYHAAVNEGETKTVSIGYYVPVKNAEELHTQCRIVISGCHDEGYVYEIPEGL